MRRGPKRKMRSGHGAFPHPDHRIPWISINADPLHTSDQWEELYRPFWSVCWWCGTSKQGSVLHRSQYVPTMTPTFCPLAVYGAVPYYCDGVSVGAVGTWIDADWKEHLIEAFARRAVAKGAKLNPVQFISGIGFRSGQESQRYAVHGDIRQCSYIPDAIGKTEWKPPTSQQEHYSVTRRVDLIPPQHDLGGES